MDLPPFDRFLGVRVERDDDGGSVCTLELEPHHCNRRGVAHGGVVSALLDTALGAAVIASIPKEWWCATVSLTVHFVRGGRGERLVATGRVRRRGAQVAFAAGEVRDAQGRLVATAEGNWHLWPHRPGSRPAPNPNPFVVLRESGERVEVGKILAVGRNYAGHVAEMGGDPSASEPVLFFKPPSAIVHDGEAVILPTGLGDVHHEVELVAVIGRRGRRIPEARALDHVLGYAVGLDMTLRGLQTDAKRAGAPWSLAKGFDTSAPVGTVAPRDEVGDGSGLGIRVAVDGETRQSASTSAMVHSVARLVAFASTLVTLERGDLLFTGTPAGVGPVRPGDVLEAEIDRVGRLSVEVRAEDDGDAGAG